MHVKCLGGGIHDKPHEMLSVHRVREDGVTSISLVVNLIWENCGISSVLTGNLPLGTSNKTVLFLNIFWLGGFLSKTTNMFHEHVSLVCFCTPYQYAFRWQYGLRQLLRGQPGFWEYEVPARQVLTGLSAVVPLTSDQGGRLARRPAWGGRSCSGWDGIHLLLVYQV